MAGQESTNILNEHIMPKAVRTFWLELKAIECGYAPHTVRHQLRTSLIAVKISMYLSLLGRIHIPRVNPQLKETIKPIEAWAEEISFLSWFGEFEEVPRLWGFLFKLFFRTYIPLLEEVGYTYTVNFYLLMQNYTQKVTIDIWKTILY